MTKALINHWPEYLMEAAGLGIFMIFACLFATLIEYPGSPLRQAIGNPLLRPSQMGFAMGLTAIAIIYSPWGKQSGAHINPAVTLTFYRLGKIKFWDALFYVVAQFFGGLAGVLLAAIIVGDAMADPTVNYVVTVPGSTGIVSALVAEFIISFGLMFTVLLTTGCKNLANLTGVFAGALVVLYITIEAPYSGMSINPARTFGSALPANLWTAFWVYMVVPPAGMLAAAQVYLYVKGRGKVACAKLHHQNDKRCIHCGANDRKTNRL